MKVVEGHAAKLDVTRDRPGPVSERPCPSGSSENIPSCLRRPRANRMNRLFFCAATARLSSSRSA